MEIHMDMIHSLKGPAAAVVLTLTAFFCSSVMAMANGPRPYSNADQERVERVDPPIRSDAIGNGIVGGGVGGLVGGAAGGVAGAVGRVAIGAGKGAATGAAIGIVKEHIGKTK
jgi:hypothetical protein